MATECLVDQMSKCSPSPDVRVNVHPKMGHDYVECLGSYFLEFQKFSNTVNETRLNSIIKYHDLLMGHIILEVILIPNISLDYHFFFHKSLYSL